MITSQDLFIFKQEGLEKTGKIKGRFKPTGNIPKFYEELKEKGIPVSMGIFSDD